ncbi:MAG: outer membrane beta-barrel protein [Rhodanobacteraceae bacterium]
MRNTLTALAVAAAFVAAAPAFAQDNTGNTNNGGFFINGNAGHSDVISGPNSGSDTGYAIDGGYRWALTPQFALGAEVGYNDLGNVQVKNVFNNQPVVANNKASLHGATVGATAHYNFTPNWYVSGRTGLYAWKGKGISNDPFPIDEHRSDNGYYAGAGAGYDFNRNFGVGLAYDYYHADKSSLNLSTNLFSVNAEYRF